MAEFINEPHTLIKAAAGQGIEMSEKAAKVILGYMEGHDYALGLEDDGSIARYDLTNGDKGSWEPYSVKEAIIFAAEMCGEIIQAEEDKPEPNEEYLASLRDDDTTLTPLYEAAIGWRGRTDGGV